MSTPRTPRGTLLGRPSPANAGEEITDESLTPSFSDMKGSVPAPEIETVVRPLEETPRKVTAEEIVARFNSLPWRPPAPQPDMRAASDGGMFVAHYAVMDPARSVDTPAPVPSVLFEEHTIPSPEALAEASLSEDQRAFKAQILATPKHLDADVHFDAPPLGTTMIPSRRRHRGSVAWGLVGVLLALIAAVLLRPKPVERAPATNPSVGATLPSAFAEPVRAESVTTTTVSAVSARPSEPVVARPAQTSPPHKASSAPSPASAPRPRSSATTAVPAPAASTSLPTPDPTSDPRFQPGF